MAKYTEDAEKLLGLVGGKDNISQAAHCMTRMRFVLVDPAKADVAGIEALPSVKGSFTQAGQFQVIIGNDVADFHKEFVAVSGVSEASKDDVKSAAAANQNPIQRVMGEIAAIFAPLIPAIITGGLILGFRNVLGDMPYFGPDGTSTLASLSQFWTGVNHFLWLIGEAVFHLGIPVGICWSITNRMGGTPMLGIVLGLTLVSSQLLNAYGVPSATAETWATYSWNFGVAQVHMVGYQAQVIPAILAAVVFNYLERFFKKITPTVVQMIVVPFCSLLLGVIAAHFILGPIGWAIGSWISDIVMAGITSPFRWLFGIIFGAFYAPLVITGLHHMTNAVDMQLIAASGGTMLWPMIALSNIAQGSSVLAMSVLQRRNEGAQQINIPSCISCYLGVTEPAIFGVNLKYIFPFVCSMIGSGIAGGLCTLTSVTANAIGVGGLPGILSIQPQFILSFALCMLVSIAVPFALTYIVGKHRGIGNEAGRAAAPAGTGDSVAAPFAAPAARLETASAVSPVSGDLMELSRVDDGVFSAGMMGEGVAIVPTGSVAVSPVAGTVTAVIEDSKHAVGITTDDGIEFLVHVGLDTVDMKGKGFELFCRQGDRVAVGDKLLSFDRAAIAEAGHPDIVVLIVTDRGRASGLDIKSKGHVRAGDDKIISFS
ncbi:PTS trehalose transporter subunit IIBC [Coriobacteriales bacterium OH1046]|nr:PTS trehalose transporter subunit IIBC [Coriobacteriales bacterium OH1046]